MIVLAPPPPRYADELVDAVYQLLLAPRPASADDRVTLIVDREHLWQLIHVLNQRTTTRHTPHANHLQKTSAPSAPLR
jgi:hypothetical protein